MSIERLLVGLIQRGSWVDHHRDDRRYSFGSVSRERFDGAGYRLEILGVKGSLERQHRFYLRFAGLFVVFDEDDKGEFSIRRGDDHTLTLAALL